jgi:hypothetical protein
MLGFGQGSGALSITSSALVPNTALNFGQVQSGETQQQTLTVTNTSTAAVEVRRITSAPPFLSTSTCGTELAASATCAITLTYAPVDAVTTANLGPRQDNGQLTIESDAAASPAALALTGSVTPIVASAPNSGSVLATYSLTQGALTFPNTSVGDVSTPQTVTLTNTGTQTLEVSGMLAPADFSVASACQTLLFGQSCTIAVRFTPGNGSTAAVRTGTLEIQSNAANSLEYISLLGASVAAPLTVAPTALDFGTVAVGTSDQLGVTVTNTSATPITFISATTDAAAYSVGEGTCPADGSTLAAGASCTLDVTFAPTASGTSTGTLTLATDATQLPLTVALTGTGVSGQLQVTPAALAFGTIAVGSPANLTLTLLNAGTAIAGNIATSITGADAAEFAVTVPCSSPSLAPNQGCNLTVTFTPTSTAAASATLNITGSEAGTPLAVPLTGSGTQPGSFTLTVNGGSSASATVKSGSPASYSLQVSPSNGFTGAVALTCTPVTPAEYASCSLLASSLTLTNGPQTSTVTINTITSASGSVARRAAALAGILLLLPWWRRRTRRRWMVTAWAAVAALTVMAALNGCGGGPKASTLRYSPAGTYQYQVTASSTSGPAISQTVTLNLIVQ